MHVKFDRALAVDFAADFLASITTVHDRDGLRSFMDAVCRELGFRYFALITHEDLRIARPGQVDIRLYPDAISERIIGQGNFRRDPVMRGCVFADTAFLWSELDKLITINR